MADDKGSPGRRQAAGARRSGEAVRLVKALPVYVTLGAQTVTLVILLTLMYAQGVQNTKDIALLQQQRQSDLQEFRAAVSRIDGAFNTAAGPAAVSVARIAALEASVVENSRSVVALREEQVRMRLEAAQRLGR